ncbi:LLM class flavin-dependent oxidoreductase [Kineococcus sp. LSe6-4]|uniref:LLM class flavin-dependent oxidoreductase n=1 Tax=Kineococcus halophytocola TaxID=3234027 RepID=A0ABV4GYB1_9ACTN
MSPRPPVREPLRWAVELDGAGRHPAAWRLPGARPGELFTAAHWRRLAATVEAADLDLLVVPDAYRLQSAEEGDQRGRLDAVALAAHLAPLTRRAGLVPVVTTTHTEPFHTQKAIATLDLTSRGRAGWQVEVSTTSVEADLFGRKPSAPAEELWREAAETVDVARRLWDSWEDDAVIRDVATGRYVDRDRLHPVEFAGEFFSVKGPSITPRSPQGQPLVVVPVREEPSLALAAAQADVARLETADPDRAGTWAAALPDATVLLDVEVLLRREAGEAADVAAQLEEWSPGHAPRTLRHVGTPETFLDLLGDLPAGVGGVAVVPLDLPVTLDLLAADVVPRVARPVVRGSTLRERFGLPRPASRYARGVPA